MKIVGLNIVVIGIGYVGTSVGISLSEMNNVFFIDINKLKVDKINSYVSPIKDELISQKLQEAKISKCKLNFKAFLADDDNQTTVDNIFKKADIAIIALPTNFIESKRCFDTLDVECAARRILLNNDRCIILIKSTIPIGFISTLRERLNCKRLIYSPEFLRENFAFYDTLNPSRIIIGVDKTRSEEIYIAEYLGEMFKRCTNNYDIPILIMGIEEAEAVKLFSNAYLAMRVAYFNEIDMYAECNGLSTREIIEGMGFDERIGCYYNNPSFGFGGYCLPKDSKQLLSSFNKLPQKIIGAIIESNEHRKRFIADRVMAAAIEKGFTQESVIGIFRLSMKNNSDNYRNSSIIDVLKYLKKEKFKMVIYEPNIDRKWFMGIAVIKSLQEFKDMSSIILTNRYSKLLDDVGTKVYTRDIFNDG